MSNTTGRMIGVALTGQTSREALDQVLQVDYLGIPAAWATTGGSGGDAMTFFGAALMRTRDVIMGTSIIPTYPRHPLVAAQQVQALEDLDPGRFRLGVGPSHQAIIEGMYGIEFNAPLGHLREYIQILKTLFRDGQVNYEGRHYKVNGRIPSPIDVPVMASALRQRAFELCGAEADGAISWVCPGVYLRDVAVPAIQAGAEKAGRPAPPLIAHAPVCVHDDPNEVYAAAREQMGFYPRAPFYANMFADAGYPEASNGTWSDGMLDAVVLSGNEETVEEKLMELFSFGATEILVSPIVAGGNREASRERTLNLLARVTEQIEQG